MSEEADAKETTGKRWADVKRRSGCIWSCLTEPVVIVVLVIASLLGGFFLGKKKGEEAAKNHAEPPDD